LTDATELRYYESMKTYQEILKDITQRGYRMTKARCGILKLLCERRKPVAAIDMQALLERDGVIINKTTVYRELEFLECEKYIDKVQLKDGLRYYEIVMKHHHHVVCVKCDSVDDIVLHHELWKEEQRIKKEMKFQVLQHSLEFFGICKLCQVDGKN
jgi:Fe2+ or Zn2+ uptake regulation protein